MIALLHLLSIALSWITPDVHRGIDALNTFIAHVESRLSFQRLGLPTVAQIFRPRASNINTIGPGSTSYLTHGIDACAPDVEECTRPFLTLDPSPVCCLKDEDLYLDGDEWLGPPFIPMDTHDSVKNSSLLVSIMVFLLMGIILWYLIDSILWPNGERKNEQTDENSVDRPIQQSNQDILLGRTLSQVWKDVQALTISKGKTLNRFRLGDRASRGRGPSPPPLCPTSQNGDTTVPSLNTSISNKLPSLIPAVITFPNIERLEEPHKENAVQDVKIGPDIQLSDVALKAETMTDAGSDTEIDIDSSSQPWTVISESDIFSSTSGSFSMVSSTETESHTTPTATSTESVVDKERSDLEVSTPQNRSISLPIAPTLRGTSQGLVSKEAGVPPTPISSRLQDSSHAVDEPSHLLNVSTMSKDSGYEGDLDTEGSLSESFIKAITSNGGAFIDGESDDGNEEEEEEEDGSRQFLLIEHRKTALSPILSMSEPETSEDERSFTAKGDNPEGAKQDIVSQVANGVGESELERPSTGDVEETAVGVDVVAQEQGVSQFEETAVTSSLEAPLEAPSTPAKVMDLDGEVAIDSPEPEIGRNMPQMIKEDSVCEALTAFYQQDIDDPLPSPVLPKCSSQISLLMKESAPADLDPFSFVDEPIVTISHPSPFIKQKTLSPRKNNNKRNSVGDDGSFDFDISMGDTDEWEADYDAMQREEMAIIDSLWEEEVTQKKARTARSPFGTPRKVGVASPRRGATPRGEGALQRRVVSPTPTPDKAPTVVVSPKRDIIKEPSSQLPATDYDEEEEMAILDKLWEEEMAQSRGKHAASPTSSASSSPISNATHDVTPRPSLGNTKEARPNSFFETGDGKSSVLSEEAPFNLSDAESETSLESKKVSSTSAIPARAPSRGESRDLDIIASPMGKTSRLPAPTPVGPPSSFSMLPRQSSVLTSSSLSKNTGSKLIVPRHSFSKSLDLGANTTTTNLPMHRGTSAAVPAASGARTIPTLSQTRLPLLGRRGSNTSLQNGQVGKTASHLPLLDVFKKEKDIEHKENMEVEPFSPRTSVSRIPKIGAIKSPTFGSFVASGHRKANSK